jgi:hypothetical protein
MSFPKVARTFGITTPDGNPNPGMVKRLIDGYQPRRPDTLKRCGIFPVIKPVQIQDEPARRVLTGAWKLCNRWVGPEEFFGARS